jgi:pimeloyl-ACP methyl ester carboxylesterase
LIAPALRKVVADDGVSIAYRESGPAHGPVVVLCHGICAAGRQFEADARHFAAQGYRVIVPDLRGHGGSRVPRGRADFTIKRMAADNFALLEAAGVEHVHWVGNSLGGIVGLEMLAQQPKRFASFATFGTAYQLNLPAFAPPVLPMLYRGFGAPLLSRMAAAMTTRVPAARKLIAEMIEDFDPVAGHAIAREVRAYDLRAAARSYRGPVLLLRGGRDVAVNMALGPSVAAMAGHPRFRRVGLAQAGHCANLDMPGPFRKTIEAFWRDAEVGGGDSQKGAVRAVFWH